MKKNSTKATRAALEKMSPDEFDAFVYGRLYDLFRAFPSLKEYQRREMMEILFKLEYLAKPEEIPLWNRIINHFKELTASVQRLEVSNG